ncbi:hypothetical protein EPR50_G00060590 [Perca flavescens]|uniref:Uncharacterized protein n=2 Tax=Perca flavescens TaxID=8167 RepID=A0A484D7N9_PERFV|nr:hypothetical protein EPR50_G00060590 [Perca flavescens]
MTIASFKDKGVTVAAVTADSKSMLPPLCQILKSLCYSPMCCSVYKGLIQTNVTAALGTIQIMVGLFNIGLVPGRTYMYPKDLTSPGVAYWLGAVFIIAGIMSILAGRFSSICLVGFAVFVNIVGLIFAIVGIALNAKDLADAPAIRMCDLYIGRSYYGECENVAYYVQRLLTTMDITMIVLAVLQLCVCISFAVLGINAVVNRQKEEGDVDDQQQQLNAVLLTNPCA